MRINNDGGFSWHCPEKLYLEHIGDNSILGNGYHKGGDYTNKKIFNGFILLMTTVLLMGCNFINENQKDTINVKEEDKEIITEYLNNKTGDQIVPSGVECYSAFEILGTSSDNIYLWVLKENISGCGGSMPVSLNVKKDKDNLDIISYKIPGDGDDYGKDIDKLFPKNVRKKIKCGVGEHNFRVNRLQKQIDEIKMVGNKN